MLQASDEGRAPDEKLILDIESQDEVQSVGVLGWLGFAIINFACWGIIGISTSSSWLFGLGICIAYIALTMGLAHCLGTSSRFKNFVNLFWVLACSFVFVAGTILSLYLSVGEVGDLEPSVLPDEFVRDGFLDILPANSSDALKAWAQNSRYPDTRKPTFATFEDRVYFESFMDAGSTEGLHVSDGVDVRLVPGVESPANLYRFDSKLYFLAKEKRGSPTQLWSVSAATPIVADQITRFNMNIDHLFYDEQSSKLWFKGRYYCGDFGRWVVETVFYSDGTESGTFDVRNGDCPALPTSSAGPTPEQPDMKNMGLYVLFLADAPMIGLASWVLLKRKMPGVCLNLWLGGIVLFLAAYAQVRGPDDLFFSAFKWFLTIYSSIAYVALAAVSIQYEQVPLWISDLKTWLVVAVSITFYCAVHLVLEVPFTDKVWPWWAYFVVILIQMLLSVLVSRTLPMVLGAVGLFACSVRLSWGIVNLLGLNGVISALTMFGLVALMGVAIIGGALFYKNKEVAINARLREIFSRFKRPDITSGTDEE